MSQSEREFGPKLRLKDYKRASDTRCIYCGDYFQCRDHPIPVSYSSHRRSYKEDDTVYCCTECNTFLGSSVYPSIEDRAFALFQIYSRKKRKYLQLKPWDAEDLEEMGYNLRSLINHSQYLRDLYNLKLRNLEIVSDGGEAIAIHM